MDGPTSSMLHIKTQGHQPSGSGDTRRLLNGISYELALRPSCSCDKNPLHKTSVVLL